MTRSTIGSFSLVMLNWFAFAGHAMATDASKTNVILIPIDDLGWKDVGCYGSEYYQTPNIDRLADEGMRFTDGYAACNVCSPTRAAILSGKYPARLLLTQWLPSGRWSRTKDRLREGRYVSNLPLEEFTVAEAMREAGYRTAFMGKWHLGTETYYYPEHQEFDVNIAGRDYPHYNQHPQSFPCGVIRAGDWKLIEAFETGKLSLYNLADDIGETHDLSAEEPAKVAALHVKLKAWRESVGADPMRPNPEFTDK